MQLHDTPEDGFKEAETYVGVLERFEETLYRFLFK
jgi:hypothetical protein